MSKQDQPPPAELSLAIHRHERGRLAEAEAIYRQILERDPDHTIATEKLGVLYMQSGRPEIAEALIRKVIAQRPEYPDAHGNLGVVLASTGRLGEALASHRRALALGMDPILTNLNIGLTQKELGQWSEALTSLRKAAGVSGANRPKWMLALGETMERLGDLRGAETTLRMLIGLETSDTNGLRALARVQSALGKAADAVDTYVRLRELAPGDVNALEGHARALMAAGRADEAITTMREVVTKESARINSAVELAAWLSRADRRDEAMDLLRRLARSHPEDPNVQNALGAMLHDARQYAEAVQHFRQVIRLTPASPHAYQHLALALHASGQKLDAAAAAQAAIACDENFIDAYIIRGRFLHELGYPAEAIDCMQKALKISPHNKEALVQLAHLLREQNRPGEAVDMAREALLTHPDDLPARIAYAIALEGDSRFVEAEKEIRDLLTTRDDSVLHAGLGNVLKSRWQISEAIAAYRKALSFPDAHLPYGANLMLALNYPEDLDPETVFQDHVEFGRRVQAGIDPMPPRAPRPDDDDPERPLRIGYISADLRAHVVMNFMEPILSRHDRRRFAVTLYAEVMVEDQMSVYLKSLGHRWVRTVGMTDEEVARRIREDGIDILIDLSGHTAGNRLRTLAYRPAPVQVTYLGYPNTTGMDRVDVRLIDAITDPPGEADRFASEKLVRLPGCFLCFRVPADAPAVNKAPCLENGYVTFGSFNKLAKISPGMLDNWARILKRVPTARLFIKGWSLADSEARDRILGEFRQRGIEPERIIPRPFIQDRHYMTGFHEVDIALDTNPYSGTTTTFDSLVMGVPVVTLKGNRHSARVSASMLTRLGRPEWVAEGADEYVEIAARLASDPAALAAIRAGLRDEVQRSPLADGDSFIIGFEETLRSIWRDRPVQEAPPEPAPAAPPSDPLAEPVVSLPEPTAEEARGPLPPALATRFWTQRIVLPDGWITPGMAPLAVDAYGLPDSLAGLRVLDADARDGFWCFEALRRGADHALGLHWAGPGRPDYLVQAPANFDAARTALGVDADRCRRLDLAPDDPRLEQEGPFDLILLSDFQLDWRDPLKLLRALAKVCAGEIVLEGAVSDLSDSSDPPSLSFDAEHPEQRAPRPNLAMLGLLLESAGFTEVEGWLMHDAPVEPALRRGFVKGRGPAV